jgi:hypothetical protein
MYIRAPARRFPYPLIREALKDPKVYNEEIVGNEMFFLLDYYPTESSGHNSGYKMTGKMLLQNRDCLPQFSSLSLD